MILSWGTFFIRPSSNVLHYKFPFAATRLHIRMSPHVFEPLNTPSVMLQFASRDQVIRGACMAEDASGRNQTLHVLQEHLVKNLERCAHPDRCPDLQGISLQYICGRGDWKFKCAWLAETRSYQNLRANASLAASFCRRCKCTSNIQHMHWADYLHFSWHDPAAVLETLDANSPQDLP